VAKQKAATETTEPRALSPVSNDGETVIGMATPYVARVTIEGVCPILFHRYSVEAVKTKSGAGKNSKAKSEDDVESYVYRDDHGELCVPGSALKGALVGAARSRQDPRSPRKSAMDLYKAIIVPLTDLASTGKKVWDFLDQRRAVIQRNGICRTRPALAKGWRATFDVLVQAPEYLDPASLNALVADAGRLQGVCDHRPTYGRFQVVSFEETH
jgi:hypothetical protein